MAMTERDRIVSRLAASTRRRLRIASLCLLGVAASVSIFASVPRTGAPSRPKPVSVAATQPATSGYSEVGLAVATPDARSSRHSADNWLRQAHVTPRISGRPRSTRRIFVEHTPPLPSEALTAMLEVPVKQYALLGSPSPVFRNGSSSGSSRQRAP